MKILSMTATFGKLEQETLHLKPGLNIITAPNEWGKSTWCAFLMAMLYGVDTRQRTKMVQLADKDHYKPWSGKPMEGSMEILWEGRRITIQRRTKGRTPMGDFKAFETDSGNPVPELTASNCGEQLLGVERSVYSRSGFIHGGDLPITQDESFNRRLNQLVTTGDDSDMAPTLERKLRELKNRLQHNRTGLIPSAREELAQSEKKLAELEALENRIQMLQLREEQLAVERAELENHLAHLQEQENRRKLQLVSDAKESVWDDQVRLDSLEEAAASLPERMSIERDLQRVRHLEEAIRALELEQAAAQTPPEPPHDYPDAAEAKRDADTLREPPVSGKMPLVLIVLGFISLLSGIACGILLRQPVLFSLAFVGAVAIGTGYWLHRKDASKESDFAAFQAEIRKRYGTDEPDEMIRNAAAFEAEMKVFQASKTLWDKEQAERNDRLDKITADLQTLPPRDILEHQLATLSARDDAKRLLMRAEKHLKDLEAVTENLQPAADLAPDTLQLDPAAAQSTLERVLERIRQVRIRIAETRGEMSAYPGRPILEGSIQKHAARVRELERWYAAVTLAQESLEKAQRELRSRFAPRITEAARSILGSLTGGKYQRLTLDENMTLSAGAQGENTLVSTQWRSDGTADQMYLALRLAVCNVMLPGVPAVLDDALNRFDDERMGAALHFLQQEGRERQILLFSCQSREAEWIRRNRDGVDNTEDTKENHHG